MPSADASAGAKRRTTGSSSAPRFKAAWQKKRESHDKSQGGFSYRPVRVRRNTVVHVASFKT